MKISQFEITALKKLATVSLALQRELDVQAIAHAALDKIAKAARARRGVRLDAVECGALAITVCERS